ncbi:DNA translocase FtsK [Patescibacteria group bacterium]|nr:DNA translocase FtsK [Patescibacteria group bacterium]MCG2698862.1 DNA translocase FtsK [Candidatus Parcubacteria bacterium]
MASRKKIKNASEEKKTRKKKNKISADINDINEYGLKYETKRSVLAVAFFVTGLIFTFASFGKAGILGNSLYKVLETIFGAGFFLIPTAFFITTISLISSIRAHFLSHTLAGGALFLLSSLGAADIILGEKTCGYAGYFISWPFLKFFDFWASLIIFAALFAISFLIMFNTPISIKILKKEKEEKEEEMIRQAEAEKEKILTSETGEEKTITSPAIEQSASKETIQEIIPKKKSASGGEEKIKEIKHAIFAPPPLDLLEQDKGKPSSGDIKANANIIKRTLQNFGIDVEMDEINIGPSVTQYTFRPAEGIKLSRLIGLQNDLSLALAAYPLRIEAPIPGKSLVGIEIPNSTKTLIGLGTLLSEDIFQKSPRPLLISLGKDVTGRSVFANMAKMPHLLVAGATGAGKSIFIHSMIISLLYRNSPESLRFIMIDPKRVELTIYNKIPHLLTPVITDAKKSILSLKWAGKEMERRYEELLKAGVRDILSYHEKYGNYNSMPYIIIVIDELADVMATYPREMEASIVRLAQMSRAVGIHLVVSTQRPSVEVITGLIKANITSRVALQVASQIDSRTILDMAGAEKLLGSGDMLYLAGDTAKPRRIQGPLISEKEIKKVVKYIDEQYEDVILDTVEIAPEANEASNGSAGKQSSTGPNGQAAFDINFDEEALENDDEFYEEAKNLVIKAGKASTSYLQRRLKIGYSRAARLIDMMEENGIVGPADGSKPREILVEEKTNLDEHDS